ncbi:MAG: S-methyl-5-thioribose-1-phosphate isomerase [Spirochaetes bacterium]|nr:S-methyl-5-thioribose-1-phosphate isomerase [Spirochaetota bacterium]
MFTIKWNGDSVTILDQRLLPVKEVYNTYRHYSDIADSIRNMETRGAPAIGITAAMGIALAAKNIELVSLDGFKEEMNRVCDIFTATRPTAVNLFAAIGRMKNIIQQENDINAIRQLLEKEALAVLNEDVEANKALGKNGSKYLSDGDVVMTHCNAGALATGGYGTALGVIRAALSEGKNIQVYACETRPYLQGARLTAWELSREKIPVTLITDSMSGHFMRTGIIKKVIVGADRIALNGDVANKIGTYSHAVLAKENGIQFYVAAPTSTLDPNTKTGDAIVIEERGVEEVAYIMGVQIAPEGVSIRNPAFDVTPAKYIAAIITEKGIVDNPATQGIGKLLKS